MTSQVFTDLTRKVLHPSIGWADVQAGDTIEVTIFGRWGYEREQRRVVAVNWPMVRLAERGVAMLEPEVWREYEIDATKPDRIDRDLRLVSRPENNQERPA